MPRGIKKIDKVHQRIGRAKQKYPSVHHLYNISFTIDEATKTVTNMQWQKDLQKVEEANSQVGGIFS